jgi:hypothetical protein
LTWEEGGRGGEAIIIEPLAECVYWFSITLFIYHYRSHACIARDRIMGCRFVGRETGLVMVRRDLAFLFVCRVPKWKDDLKYSLCYYFALPFG